MKKKDLLVVVDMQNDFIDGSLGTPEAQKIVSNVVDKIANWNGDIAITKDTHSEDYLNTREGRFLPIKHCIKDTWGWELNEDVQHILTIKSNKVIGTILKHKFGAFALTDPYCRYQTITLIGLCTDICVISNALILKNVFPETDIYVDSSCCAGVTPAKHEAALEVMRSCQIEVY